jgi:hypothetical protein
MTAHPPPIPPDQRQPHKGEAAQTKSAGNQVQRDNRDKRNLAEQGRQGNIKQNTTNQGYQQDR